MEPPEEKNHMGNSETKNCFSGNRKKPDPGVSKRGEARPSAASSKTPSTPGPLPSPDPPAPASPGPEGVEGMDMASRGVALCENRAISLGDFSEPEKNRTNTGMARRSASSMEVGDVHKFSEPEPIAKGSAQSSRSDFSTKFPAIAFPKHVHRI